MCEGEFGHFKRPKMMGEDGFSILKSQCLPKMVCKDKFSILKGQCLLKTMCGDEFGIFKRLVFGWNDLDPKLGYLMMLRMMNT